MKKGILGVLVGLAVLPLISFAQNIGDIDISFCNSGIENQDYFTLVTEAGKTDDVCVKFKNYSQNSISIHIDFVDGGIGDGGDSVCLAPDYPVKEFSKYISNNNEDLILQGGEEIQKNYALKYPIGFSGLSHGCISYYINSDESNEGVTVVFRKVNRIDVLVGGTEVDSKINIKNVFYVGSVDSNKLGFNIENNGNIDQEVTVTGLINGWFRYAEPFDLGSFVIKAGESVLVYTNNLHIPEHKGKFYADSYISNEPSVDFSIAHSNIYSNEYSVAGTFFVHFPFFLRNGWLVALIILLIALVIAMIWRLSKNKKFKKSRKNKISGKIFVKN